MERKRFFALPGRCKEDETHPADQKETTSAKWEQHCAIEKSTLPHTGSIREESDVVLPLSPNICHFDFLHQLCPKKLQLL
jgi:hypothetical protein